MSGYNNRNLLKFDSSLGAVDRKHKTMFTRREDKIKAVLYGIAAVVCVVVLILIGKGIAAICVSITEVPDSAEKIVEEKPVVYDDTDSLLLLTVKVNDSGVPEHLVLTRFEPSEDAVYVTPLPTELYVGDGTLAEHYNAGGAADCAAAAAKYVGAAGACYYIINYSGVKSLVTEFHGVIFELPCNVKYTDPTDVRKSVNVAAGKRRYEGGETARILNCPVWPEGVEQHRLMYARVFSGLINENLTPDREKKIELLYGRAEPHGRTDANADVLQRCYEGFSHLAAANTEGSVARVITVDLVVGENGKMTCTDESFEQLAALYGDRNISEEAE